MSAQHPTLYVGASAMRTLLAGGAAWAHPPGATVEAPAVAYIPESVVAALREQLAAVARERDDYKAALTSIAHPEGDVIPAPRAVAQAALSRPATQTDGQRRDLFTMSADEARSIRTEAEMANLIGPALTAQWATDAGAGERRLLRAEDKIAALTADRDAWKARAEATAAEVDRLRGYVKDTMAGNIAADMDVHVVLASEQRAAALEARLDAVCAALGLPKGSEVAEAARARVAELEAAVKADQAQIAALEAAIRPMLADWERDDHLAFYGNGTAAQGLRDALSGGTAALAAHDAARREEIAREVEGLTPHSPGKVDDVIGIVDEVDPDVGWLFRSDVLAKIRTTK